MYKQASKFMSKHGNLQPKPKRVRKYHPDNEVGHSRWYSSGKRKKNSNPSSNVYFTRAIRKEFKTTPSGCVAHNGGILTPSKPMRVRQVRVIHGFHGNKVIYVGE